MNDMDSCEPTPCSTCGSLIGAIPECPPTLSSLVNSSRLDPLTVEAIISEAKQRIIDLEEMERLSLKNHEMILQRLGEYRRFASYQKFLIAPICRIPNELLSEIFIMCVADSNFKTPFSFSGLPWLLGKVCPLWRDIVLNTPFLWNRIPQISVQSDSLGTDPALVQMSIELARGLPLSIDIDIDTTSEYDVSTPLLDILLSHSDQISKLEISCHWRALRLLSGEKPDVREMRNVRRAR